MKAQKKQGYSSAFVTVGSTRFDQLVNHVMSEKFIRQLHELGFKQLTVQAGSSAFDCERLEQLRKSPLKVNLYNYKASIKDDTNEADLVIGHAGGGTCLEVLRAGKKLIVIANDSLMDNHQDELAQQLAADNHVVRTTIDGLSASLNDICLEKTQLEPFPPQDRSRFEEIFDEALRRVASRL